MPVDLRRIGPDDWALWRQLRLEALQDTPIGVMEWHADALEKDEAHWRERLSRDGHYLVADMDGAPVGMSIGYLDDGRPMLGAVFVRPAVRGKGVLDVLVAEVARWAREDRGASELGLYVHEDNVRARRAYERLGFTSTGETVPYDLDPTRLEQRMVLPVDSVVR